MKQLLTEYIPFVVSPQMIKESLSENNGKLIVSGTIQRCDFRNQNGRVYPRSLMEREIPRYKANEIKEHRAVGELDHPDTAIINLKNTSHNILDIWWQGNDILAKIEILSTPSGLILQKLFESGIRVGISSRGMGSVQPRMDEIENTVEVQDDFNIICFDFVSNPSTQGAFLEIVTENYNPTLVAFNKYAKLNRLITQIICGE